MTKKWYAVYTKPHCEKKVTAILTRKKIESYCPLIGVIKQKKLSYQPLFASYIFVNTSDEQLKTIKKTKGVINLVYWLDKPVVIKNDEIEAIKEFVHNHENIQLEKSQRYLPGKQSIIGKPVVTIEERLIPIKNKTVKILHTSLGFLMIAEINEAAAKTIYKESKEKNTFLKHYKEMNDPTSS
jgi:transcription antitermination factor NusG